MSNTGAVSSLPEQRLLFWRRAGQLVLSSMVIGVLAVYYPNVTDDADIWWHLRYGKTVWQTKSWLIDHAAYSWTPADGDWVYVTWLGSFLLYGIHRLGGFFGLGLAQWLIFAGIVALYNWLLRLARLPWTALHIAFLFLAGIAVNPIAVYIKPELFSILMFAVTVAVFFAVRLTGRSYLFWIYIPLFLAWVNIHGGFVYGLAFLGLVWCYESIAYLLSLPVRISKPPWLVFTIALVLSTGATFINPYGWRYWSGIYENAAAGSGHAQVISAYLPLFPFLAPPPFMFRNMNTGWCLLAMALCLAGLMAHVYATRRKIDFPVMLANALFFFAGFLMMRVSVFFAVLWMFSVVYILAAYRIGISNLAVKLSAAIAALAAIFIAWETVVFNTYRAYFGQGLSAYVPEGTVEFIKRNSVPGPLFNDYITGGYLVWKLYPDYKVFIDPRYGPYVKTGVWNTYARLLKSGSPEALSALERSYPFQTAIINVVYAPLVTDLFLFSPEWRLIYFDSAAALFIKASLAESRRWEGDMNPRRFERVTNPDILARAFALYCRYNPPDAVIIRDLYAKNVSRFYADRNEHLDWMRKILGQFRPSP